MYLGFVGFPCKFRAMNCTIIVLAGVALCVASVFLQTEALTKDPLLDNRNNKQIDERTKHVHHQHRCRTVNRQRRSIWQMFIQSIASAGETFHVKPILVDGVNDAENFGKLFKSKFHNNPKSANVMLSEDADNGEKTLTPKNKPNELNKEVGTTPVQNKATTKKFGDSEDMSNGDQQTPKKKTQKKVEQSESEAERHGEKAPMTENKPNELNNTDIPKTPFKVYKSPPKKTYKPYRQFIQFASRRYYQYTPSTYIIKRPTPPSPLVQREDKFIKIQSERESERHGEKAPMTENKPNELNQKVIPKTPFQVYRVPPKKQNIVERPAWRIKNSYDPFLSPNEKRKRLKELKKETENMRICATQITLKYAKANKVEEDLLDFLAEKAGTKIPEAEMSKLYIDGIYSKNSEATIKQFLKSNPLFKDKVVNDISFIKSLRKSVKRLDRNVEGRQYHLKNWELEEHLNDIRARNRKLLAFETDPDLLLDKI